MTARQRRITAAELRKILEEQNFCCALTGMQLEPSTVGFDHITSIADGGEHAAVNIQAVDRVINRMKNTMSNHDFISCCQMVADHSRREKKKKQRRKK